MLCASLFPAIIGTQFPGALYLTQTLNFRQVALVSQLLAESSAISVQAMLKVSHSNIKACNTVHLTS